VNDETSRAETLIPASHEAIPGNAETAAGGASNEVGARPVRRVFVVVILLLFLTSFALQSPREVSRWYLAAARETHAQYERQAAAARRLGAEAKEKRAISNGDAADSLQKRAAELEDDAQKTFQAAVALVERAAQWAPDDVELDRQLGLWYLRAEKYDLSLKCSDRIIKLRPNDPNSYQGRVVVLLEQKRYLDAVRDADEVVRLVKRGGSNFQLHTALNEAAYFRALAGADLDQALQDADEAIAMIRAAQQLHLPTLAETGADPTSQGQLDGTLAAALDTRGYIHYQQGNLDAARKDFDDAIGLHDRHRHELARRLLTSDPLERPYFRASLLGSHESQGVMLYHRGLVFSKLGDTRRASQDQQKAAAYGFDVEQGH
jgi:tetratricopeptide (TPR) repeat protein